MNNKRLWTIGLLLAVVILCAAGSWMAGSLIQSPAEAAARTAPPTPSPILVPIEERVLSADVVTRGTARFGQPTILSVAPSPLKAGAGVVTTLPEPATQLEEGDVLFTSSGRGVFLFQGEIPAYRDLVPGVEGDDVAQLERALARLGFNPGEMDGRYDDELASAVADWYAAAGWPTFSATADQLSDIRALEQELAGATDRAATAEDRLATAGLTVQAARAEKEAAARTAQAALLELQAERDRAAAGSPLAIAEARLAAGEAAVEAALAVGEAAVQAALDAEMSAGRDVQTSADWVLRVSAELETARRAAGVKIPLDEILFLPSLPVRVETLDVSVGDAASGPIMTVTNNQLAIDAALPLDEAPLVKPGMAVAIDEPDLGIAATGVVQRVADTPGTDGVDGFHVYVEIFVDETPVTLEGFSLRLTIPVESTSGVVSAVPVSALSLAADGTTRIQVDNNGVLEFVPVEPGLTADGFVEVIPVTGTLSPGQLVVIGFE